MQASIRGLGIAALVLFAGCGDDVSSNDVGPETGAESETSVESDADDETESGDETEEETESDDGPDTDDEAETDDETETNDETESGEDENDTDDPPDLEGVCGNGLLHVDEACDDGNDEPGDGCEADCTLTVTVEWMVVDPVPGYPCSEHQLARLSPEGDLFTVGAAVAGHGVLRVDRWERDTGESLASFTSAADGAFPNFNSPVHADVAPDGSLYMTNSGGFIGPIGQVWRFSSDLGLDWVTGDELSDNWGFSGVLTLEEGAVVLHGNGGLTRIASDATPLDVAQVPEDVGPWGFWPADLAAAGEGQVAILHSSWSDALDQNSVFVWHYDTESLDLAFAPWEWQVGNVQNTRMKDLEHHDGATWVLGDSVADGEEPPNWSATLWYFGVGENYPSEVRSFSEFGYVDWDARRGLAIRDDGVKVLALQHTLIGLDADGKLLWHIDASDVDPNAGISVNPAASNFADAAIDADGAMFVGSVAMPAFACDRVAWAGRVSW